MVRMLSLKAASIGSLLGFICLLIRELRLLQGAFFFLFLFNLSETFCRGEVNTKMFVLIKSYMSIMTSLLIGLVMCG